ncbi:MAG: 2-oxo acid dehydrogenase subunit E2, partial [Candidatus Nanohaloarchaea archaeon]
MSLEFELPDTGEGVTEGTFLEWLIEEGDEVEEDQTIAEVETDKAVVDVPAPADGTIKELKVGPGDTVDVGEVILVMETGDGSAEGLQQTGEQEPAEDTEEQPADEEDEAGEEEARQEPGAQEQDGQRSMAPSGDVLALPKVRKLAEEKGVDLSSIDGSGEDGRVTEQDVKAATGGERVPEDEKKKAPEQEQGSPEETHAPSNVDANATPAVRQLAREKGIDLSSIDGSGRGGKITRQDVLDAESSAGGETGGEVSSIERGEVERIELSGIRKSIGEKMEESRFTAPHVTHVEKVDVTELVELREEKKEEVDAHLTYLPFIMKSVLVGLEKYPDLNAELDWEAGELLRKKYYDFDIAVDTERGLMVPVVEDVEDRNIVELAEAIDEEVERARNGEISREEMQGGTFSITNIGVIGGEAFTPIINPPQVAILGIGRIEETAEVVEGEVVPRHTVKLSLSYDHRVVDGATAARFINTVKQNL